MNARHAAAWSLGIVAWATSGIGFAAPALVATDWVAARHSDPDVQVIALVETREQYDAGHVPGAVFLDWRTEIIDPARPERYNKVSRQRMEELLGGIGVGAGTTVVLYDNLDNRLAARMYWMMRYFGHSATHVLDGGEAAWRRAGKPLEASTPRVTRTSYRVARVNESYCTGLGFIRDRLADERVALVDGRPAKQFTGEEPGKIYHTGTEHPRRGHIPGAINIHWRDNLAGDGRFKSLDELRAMYESRGVTRDRTVVTYCNEGLHAAMPWFVLSELLGYPDVRVYDDSLAEWAINPDVPVVVGDDEG